jgi:uncharacterized protein YjbI with pentapeptide repeats
MLRHFLGLLLEFLNNNKDAIEIVIKTFTLLVAALGFFWTVNSGLKTLYDNRKSKDNEQKVKWITFFDEESQAKKLAGVYGLIKYTRDLYNEIFCLCVIEKNIHIKALLYDNLLRESQNLITEFIEINKFYTKIFAGFYSTNNSFKSNNIVDDSHLSFIYKEHIKVKNQDESLRNFRFFIDENCSENKYILDYITLSSHMIMHGFKNNKEDVIERLFFVSTDFLSNKFANIVFKSCLFIDNSASHSCFINTKIIKCYISTKNNFFRSIFENFEVNQTVLDKCNFRDCSLNNTVLSEIEFFTNCNFSGSDIKNSRIIDSRLCSIFFKGCIISNTFFQTLTMKEGCDFRGTKFDKNCKFNYINIWECNLSSCEFYDCSFTKASFGGSDLSNSKFINSNFQNVDFSGTDMKNVEFIDCEFFEMPIPKKAKNVDTIKERGCKGSIFTNGE